MPKATFTRAEIRTILGDAHTEDIENRLMALHLGVVDPLKDALQKAQKDAEDAKNSGDAAKIQKEFDDYKAEVASKEARAKKAEALREIAKDAGLSEAGIAKAVKYTDFDKIELDDKGAVKDRAGVLKGLKEEWPEYIQTTKTEGVKTPNPPAGNGGSQALKTREEIFAKDEHGHYKMDTAARQKALGELIAAEQQKGI